MDDAKHMVQSTLKLDGPIDFPALRNSTQQIGPLRLSNASSPYVIEIMVFPCMCATEGCEEQLVAVWRRNGLFTIHWLLSRDEFLEFNSLEEFRLWAITGGLNDSYGERLIMQHQSQDIFDRHYTKIPPVDCVCSACAEAVGEEGLWRRMLLSQLSRALTARDQLLEDALKTYGEEGREFAEYVFDLGYNTGRVFSEYMVKRSIEPHALVGKSFEAMKEKRSQASGAKSAGNRLERISSLVSCMETLASESPSITRVGPSALAKLAYEDAAKENPTLWSQGKGQVEEYLGEVRRGEVGAELRGRYNKIFPEQQKSS